MYINRIQTHTYEIAPKFSVQRRPPIRSSGPCKNRKGHALLTLLVIHGVKVLHLSCALRSPPWILSGPRVSSLNLANQIYIGDARRFRGRAVAARLRRVKYCVGRCSPREFNPLSILQRLRQRIHCVYGVRCPRLVYCRFSYDFVWGVTASQPVRPTSVCFWCVVGRATAPQLPASACSWWLPRATFSLSVGDGGCGMAVVIVMTTTAAVTAAVASVVVMVLA